MTPTEVRQHRQIGKMKMARFIIIDTNSGYIFGDTANLPAGQFTCSGGLNDADMAAACRAIDATNGEHGRSYEALNGVRELNGRSGYMVYLGSNAVATVIDGQDQEAIETVERHCALVGVVTWAA